MQLIRGKMKFLSLNLIASATLKRMWLCSQLLWAIFEDVWTHHLEDDASSQ